MKKIFLTILALLMALSAFPVVAFASEDAVIYTEAAVSEVAAGNTFTYSVYLSGTYDGYAIMIPKNIKGIKVTDVKGESGVDVTDFDDDVWMFSVIGGLEKKNSSKTKIGTVSVKVDSSANGVIRFGFGEETMVTNEAGDPVTMSENLATVTVRKAAIGKKGDINGDGKINTKDGVLLAQHLANMKVTVDKTVADCNGDGAVDVSDAVLLAQYLALWDVTLG